MIYLVRFNLESNLKSQKSYNAQSINAGCSFNDLYAYSARLPGTMFLELNATGGSFQAFPGTELVLKCGMRLHSNNRFIGLVRAQEECRSTVIHTRSGE